MKFFEAQAHAPLDAELPAWGVSVLESHHATDFRMEQSRHDFWQTLYLLRGSGRLVAGERNFSLAPGDAVILPPGTPHGLQDTAGQPLSLYAVNVASSILETFPAVPRAFERPARLRHPSLPAQMPDVLRRLLFEQSLHKPGCEAMMTGLALQLMVNLSRLVALAVSHPAQTTSPAPPVPEQAGRALASQTRVAAYVQELDRQFYRSETVDQVAARLGLSRRRFTDLFREATGSSWLPYVRALRLEHARLLLRDSNRTVLSIAFECGFEDVSSFYRAFKNAGGQSPDQWRKDHTFSKEQTAASQTTLEVNAETVMQ